MFVHACVARSGCRKLILDLIAFRGGWLGAEHVRDGFISETGTKLRAIVGAQHGFNSTDPDGDVSPSPAVFGHNLLGIASELIGVSLYRISNRKKATEEA